MLFPHQPLSVCRYVCINKIPVPLPMGPWTKFFFHVYHSCLSSSTHYFSVRWNAISLGWPSSASLTSWGPLAFALVDSVLPPSYYSSSKYSLSLESLHAWETCREGNRHKSLTFTRWSSLFTPYFSVRHSSIRAEHISVSLTILYPRTWYWAWNTVDA